MKIAIALALLSIIVSAPVLAADLADTPSTKKTASATTLVNKHAHGMAASKDECSDEHGMGKHYEHGMMGDQGTKMMMEPNMHALRALALSKEQQSKISKLTDDLKHNNWATQGVINDETAKLRDMYEADKHDPATIGKEYQKIFDLKRQMIETYLDTQNRIEEILTPEQLTKLKDARHEMHHMYGHHME
jgi:Spy/CpxP family protein refolding chaperone